MCRIDHSSLEGRAGNARPRSKRDSAVRWSRALRDMSIGTARRSVTGLAAGDPAWSRASPGPGQRRRRDLGDQGAGVRPRGRDEPVRRLRAGAARARLPRDPRPLLPAHAGRQAPPATRSGCCSAPGLARSASSRRSKACGKRLRRHHGYRFKRSGSGVTLRSSGGRRLARCGRAATAVGRGTIRIRRQGPLPREAAGEGVGRRPAGHQRRRPRRLRDGRGRRTRCPHRGRRPALRAQAVAARSYALAVGGGGSFDVYDDTRSQVYGGKGSETRATNRACRHTERPGRALPQARGHHLLLLELGRPDRERPVRRSRAPSPVPLPEERQGSLRRHLARPHLEGPLLAGRDGVPARRGCSRAGSARSRC